MPAPLGSNNNPNGRPKGSPNKATIRAREAIASFVEGNVDRLTQWLDQIAEDSPKDAFNAFMSVVEYHIPKLQRMEGKQDHEVKMVIEHAIKSLPNSIRSGLLESHNESGVIDVVDQNKLAGIDANRSPVHTS